MRIIRLLFLASLFMAGVANLSASEHPARGLLVFLDDTEKGYVGALTGELYIALAEKSGPILASASLLKNTFSEYSKDIQDPLYSNIFASAINSTPKTENAALAKLFDRLEKFQNDLQENRFQATKAAYKYILLRAIHFNPQEWVIKKVNEFLYLLIPMTYLHKHNIDIYDVLQDTAQSVSNTELQLGLHVNHMKTSHIQDILQTPAIISDQNYLMPVLYNDTLKTSIIFCIKSEYRNQKIPMPAWTILLTGHGQGGLKIASLPREDFKKILDFLEHKILCRLFVYDSCFSAGVNIPAVYHDITSNLQKTYSFPIVIHALTDAATFANIPTVKEDNNHNLTLVPEGNYSLAQFLVAASQPEITNYAEIVKHIFKLGSDIKANTAPQIKMPGLEWFSILDTQNVVGIGQILVASRNPRVPLNIENFFKKDPRILLLYASNIPFTLELNPGIKAIVSMIPGDGIHALHSVSSATDSVDTIIKTFMKIESLNTNKLFFIREIKGINATVDDVLISYINNPNMQTLEDAYNCVAYYLQNNELLVKDTKHGLPRKATPQEMQLYQRYAQRIIGRPQHIQEAIYHAIVAWPDPDITFSGPFGLGQRAIIETIKADTNTPLHDIFESIASMQPDHAITLIRQVRGTLPNDTTPVLLTNVIMDKGNNKLLYTFNSKFYESNNQELPYNYMSYYGTLLNPQPLFVEMREGSLLPIDIQAKNIAQIKKSLAEKRTRPESDDTAMNP